MKKKYFPCWVCRGQGGHKEVVCDDGTGPYEECGYCEGKGMIEVDGHIHKRIKRESIAIGAITRFKPAQEDWSWPDLQELGKRIEDLVLQS